MQKSSLFVSVHFDAKRNGIKGLPKAALPSWMSLVRRADLILPLVVIVWMMLDGFSPARAALWGVGVAFLLSFVRKSTRLSFTGIVKTLEAEQTTASGLVIPDTAKEKPQEGEVLAVGPGRFNDNGGERIPLDIAVGDRVIYSKYGGTEIKHGGQEYLILSARDVLAVVS